MDKVKALKTAKLQFQPKDEYAATTNYKPKAINQPKEVCSTHGYLKPCPFNSGCVYEWT